MSEDDLEIQEKLERYKAKTFTARPAVSVPIPSSPSVPDKINNLKQKEDALNDAGVTRSKYMKHIAESLVATKWVEQPDAQGNMTMQEVPDVARRNWATEMTAKLKGDMVEHKIIENSQTSILLIRSSGDKVGVARRQVTDV